MYTGMSIAATQTSLGQPLSGTQAKVRRKRTGSCASGEPFGPDSATAGYHRGAFEKAVREIEDMRTGYIVMSTMGSLLSPHTVMFALWC